MKLMVKERIILLSSLPNQGDITTLKIVRKLKEDLSFSEKEHKKIDLQSKDGGFFWSSEVEKDVEIGEKAMEIIVESLTELNKKKLLTADHLDVYERFVEKEEA